MKIDAAQHLSFSITVIIKRLYNQDEAVYLLLPRILK